MAMKQELPVLPFHNQDVEKMNNKKSAIVLLERCSCVCFWIILALMVIGICLLGGALLHKNWNANIQQGIEFQSREEFDRW